MGTDSALVQRLKADHKATILALTELRRALVQRDREAARRRAEELDLLAGPHIRFEEQSLYPALRKVDAHRIDALHREHETIAVALGDIRRRLEDGDGHVPYRVLAAELTPFFNHTLSCDGVLYLVERFGAAQQDELCRELDSGAVDPLCLTEYLHR